MEARSCLYPTGLGTTEIKGACLGATLIVTLFFRWQCSPLDFPRFHGSLFCDLSSPSLPSNSEVTGSLKTLPLGHLVSLGKVSSQSWSVGLGILVFPVKVEDTLTGWVGLVFGLQRAGLTAVVLVNRMLHGRGLLL